MGNISKDKPLGILLGLCLYMLIVMKSCTTDAAVDTVSTQEPHAYDQSAYTRVLSDYVDAGRVNYAAISNRSEDLARYLAQLEELDPALYDSWPTAQQIAFWINAYNACTLTAVIEEYPVKGIRAIPRVWSDARWRIMGANYCLDDMEHTILRRQFKEPRIHAALVCAAISCPPLRSEAYRGSALEEQLNDQLRKVAQGKTWIRIDQPGQAVYLSRLFKWYGQDFQARYGDTNRFSNLKAHEAAVLEALYPYLQESDRQFVGNENFVVHYLPYDWGLNAR